MPFLQFDRVPSFGGRLFRYSYGGKNEGYTYKQEGLDWRSTAVSGVDAIFFFVRVALVSFYKGQ